MAINVVVSNDDLTVLGPPASIDLQVDIGPEGPRGSYIYSGFGDPNLISGPFINNPQEVGDLYYRTSNNIIYQYSSVPGGDQWVEISSLTVAATEAQELYDAAELLSASSIFYAQSASASAEQALANVFAASATYLTIGSASSTYATITSLNNIDFSPYLTLVTASNTYATQISPSISTPTISTPSISNATLSGSTIFSNYVDFENANVVGLDLLPNQTGNSNKFLTTNGTNAFWDNIDLSHYLTIDLASSTYLTQENANNTFLNSYLASTIYLTRDSASATYITPERGLPDGGTSGQVLVKFSLDNYDVIWSDPIGGDGLPDQTGNAGKYLTSSGSVASWATLDLSTKSDKLLSTNSQNASYTLVLSDADKILEMNVASANNLTVPLNSSQAFPIGTQITILQTGTGQTTIVATGGVTINATPGLKLRTQWSSATLIKRAENTWVAIGDLSA
jgi:hypothetical protein